MLENFLSAKQFFSLLKFSRRFKEAKYKLKLQRLSLVPMENYIDKVVQELG